MKLKKLDFFESRAIDLSRINLETYGDMEESARTVCGSNGLGIFNFLLFLVYLLALIQNGMIDVVNNFMIRGKNRSQNGIYRSPDQITREEVNCRSRISDHICQDIFNTISIPTKDPVKGKDPNPDPQKFAGLIVHESPIMTSQWPKCLAYSRV